MSKRHRHGRRVDATGRSIGDEQFIGLGYSTVRSPAWRSLSGPAVKVWCELRSRYNGANNGRLSLSLDEGARLLHLSKNTVRRALDELERRGFIAMTRKGRWYGRLASEWRVTDKSCNGYVPTRDWQRWQPGADLRAPRPEPESEADKALAAERDG